MTYFRHAVLTVFYFCAGIGLTLWFVQQLTTLNSGSCDLNRLLLVFIAMTVTDLVFFKRCEEWQKHIDDKAAKNAAAAAAPTKVLREPPA